jgi:hypothetical protein
LVFGGEPQHAALEVDFPACERRLGHDAGGKVDADEGFESSPLPRDQCHADFGQHFLDEPFLKRYVDFVAVPDQIDRWGLLNVHRPSPLIQS